jgi:hypothetical protein
MASKQTRRCRRCGSSGRNRTTASASQASSFEPLRSSNPSRVRPVVGILRVSAVMYQATAHGVAQSRSSSSSRQSFRMNIEAFRATRFDRQAHRIHDPPVRRGWKSSTTGGVKTSGQSDADRATGLRTPRRTHCRQGIGAAAAITPNPVEALRSALVLAAIDSRVQALW